MPRPMRIKRITIAGARALVDLVSVWVSAVVSFGGVCGVGVVMSGAGLRGVGVRITTSLDFGVVAISEAVRGTIRLTFVPEDDGKSPTVQPVPVVSQ